MISRRALLTGSLHRRHLAAGRAPIIVTAYYAESRASPDERNAVLAEVGRLASAV